MLLSMLDQLIRNTLPFRTSHPILLRRAQRYYRREVLDRYTERDHMVIDFLKGTNMPSTLLTGHQKGGNTWTRFVVANYFNILAHPEVGSTLTFDELYRVQSNVLEYRDLTPPPPGAPLFIYSHQHYRKVFGHFDTVAYVYRHPLDTLISYYYFITQREKPFPTQGLSEREKARLMDKDAFVLHYALSWVLFHLRTAPKAHIVLNYERMKADPIGQFTPLLERMTGTVDRAALEKSIQLSSFDSVREKQRQVDRPQGHSSSDLKVEFTRSGATKQYERELKPSTIEQVRWLLQVNGIEEPA